MSDTPPTAAPLIRMTDVVKTYDTGEVPFTALRGIDLDVAAGEFIGLIDVDERRLAAPRLANKPDELAGLDVQVYAAQRGERHLARVVGLDHVGHADERRGGRR